MARYRMDDGTVIDTARASKSWPEATRWDGHNHNSVATASQWAHQTLYRSRRGRYYLEHVSQWQGSTPHADWVSEREAVRWLLASDHEIPDELAALADEVTE
jgi:hypothetical protein